ncbi:MAG: hypothetical protein WDO14_24545 [Bacteroidota bacterium]
MNEKFINPLKVFQDRITYLPGIGESFPSYLMNRLQTNNISLNETRLELGKRESWINWSQYSQHHSFYFDFDDNESLVRDWLRNSILRNYPFVVMEFGYQIPTAAIPLDIFIDYWYELVIIAGYESVVLTDDGKLFMEFVRRDYSLKSNFLIKPL